MDYPRDELIRSAEQILRETPTAEIYFKATCPQCGARCCFDEANTIYEAMECGICNFVFPFVKGNYLLIVKGEVK